MPASTRLSASRVATARAEAGRRLAELGVSDATVQVLDDGSLSASGNAWTPVDVGQSQPLWLQLPVRATGAVNAAGIELTLCAPPSDVLAEGEAYARAVLARGDAPVSGTRRPPGATHEVFTDEQGRRCLRRRGFA